MSISIESRQGAERAAKILQDWGMKNAVTRGGHLTDSQGEYCTGWLFTPNKTIGLSGKRFPTSHTHGTGCTFSACIAAELARGFGVPETAQTAKDHIAAAISHPLGIRAGHEPVSHWTYWDG